MAERATRGGKEIVELDHLAPSVTTKQVFYVRLLYHINNAISQTTTTKLDN